MNGPLPPLTTIADTIPVTFLASGLPAGVAEKVKCVAFTVYIRKRMGAPSQAAGIRELVVEDGMVEFIVPIVSIREQTRVLRVSHTYPVKREVVR